MLKKLTYNGQYNVPARSSKICYRFLYVLILQRKLHNNINKSWNIKPVNKKVPYDYLLLLHNVFNFNFLFYKFSRFHQLFVKYMYNLIIID